MFETSSSLLMRVRDMVDEKSWREFVALYRPLILDYVRKQGVGEHETSDVVQETFIRLVRALPTFELDRTRGRFRTWLWQVTRNALVDWRRHQDRQVKAEADWFEHGKQQDQSDWNLAYHRRVLEFALEQVRPNTQATTWACFEEHLLRGRPAAEVAAEMGLTTNALYVNASRVLKRVREQCHDYLEELGDDLDRLPG